MQKDIIFSASSNLSNQPFQTALDDVDRLVDRKQGEILTEFQENISQGKRHRGIIVKQLTDEIDPEDREEIHRYVQLHLESKYFDNIKSLLIGVKPRSPERDDVIQFVHNIHQLAIRWKIQYKDSIKHFLDCVSALVMEIDTSNPVEVQWFVYHN